MGAEVKNFVAEKIERQCKPERLRVQEIQRLPEVGLTVLVFRDRSGEKKALVIRDNKKPEDYREIDTVFQKVRNSRALRVAVATASGAASLAGCVADFSDHSNTKVQGSGIGHKYSPMTVNDMNNLGAPQMAAWTQFGDERTSIVNIDGKTVIIVSRNENRPYVRPTLWYVECDEFANCLTVSTAREIGNLPFVGGYYSGGIYIALDGTKKMIFSPYGSSGLRELEVTRNDDGFLETNSDFTTVTPAASANEFTLNNNNGAPHLIHDDSAPDSPYARIRNLYTLDERAIPLRTC